MTSIVALKYSDIQTQDINLLTDMIYRQFEDLSNQPKLKHTPRDIHNTLLNENVLLVLLMEKEKMIGYLLSYIEHLEDGRRILFISYVYIAKQYRRRGYGDRLMSYVEDYADKNKCDGVMLIYDTENTKLNHFYEKRGYMPDLQLRRYDQHEIVYKYV
jgi:ribosomal protein S18 acetylase RimI-like enzyme